MSRQSGIPAIANPNHRANTRPSASRLEQNERLIRGARGIGSTAVRLRPWGLEIGVVYGSDAFDFKKIDGAKILIYGGYISMQGRELITVPDDTEVTITYGSATTPSFVAFKIAAHIDNWGDWELVNTAAFPQDTGTHYYRPILRAYKNSQGNAVYVKPARCNIILGAPI